MAGLKPPMPECWGHRGASAAYPENTIASFERAIRDGAEGLESGELMPEPWLAGVEIDPNLRLALQTFMSPQMMS